MKKMLLSLVSLTVVSPTFIVASCTPPTANYNDDPADSLKFLSLKELTSNLIKANGIKVGPGAGKSLYSALESSMGGGTTGVADPDWSIISSTVSHNVNVIAMANDLLQKLSLNPTYDWLSKKVTEQSNWFLFSNFGELAKSKSALMSPTYWIPLDKWGVSITFLNADKTGWRDDTGVDPAYFRLNIIGRITYDDSGNINRNDSNPAAFVFGDDGNLVVDVKQDPVYGEIFNGWMGGTEPIALTDVYDPTLGGYNTGLFDYTPTVMDMKSNFNLGLNLEDIMKNKDVQTQVKSSIDDYLNHANLKVFDNQFLTSNVALDPNTQIDTINYKINNAILAGILAGIAFVNNENNRTEPLTDPDLEGYNFTFGLILQQLKSEVTKGSYGCANPDSNTNDCSTIQGVYNKLTDLDTMNAVTADILNEFSQLSTNQTLSSSDKDTLITSIKNNLNTIVDIYNSSIDKDLTNGLVKSTVGYKDTNSLNDVKAPETTIADSQSFDLAYPKVTQKAIRAGFGALATQKMGISYAVKKEIKPLDTNQPTNPYIDPMFYFPDTEGGSQVDTNEKGIIDKAFENLSVEYRMQNIISPLLHEDSTDHPNVTIDPAHSSYLALGLFDLSTIYKGLRMDQPPHLLDREFSVDQSTSQPTNATLKDEQLVDWMVYFGYDSKHGGLWQLLDDNTPRSKDLSDKNLQWKDLVEFSKHFNGGLLNRLYNILKIPVANSNNPNPDTNFAAISDSTTGSIIYASSTMYSYYGQKGRILSSDFNPDNDSFWLPYQYLLANASSQQDLAALATNANSDQFRKVFDDDIAFSDWLASKGKAENTFLIPSMRDQSFVQNNDSTKDNLFSTYFKANGIEFWVPPTPSDTQGHNKTLASTILSPVYDLTGKSSEQTNDLTKIVSDVNRYPSVPALESCDYGKLWSESPYIYLFLMFYQSAVETYSNQFNSAGEQNRSTHKEESSEFMYFLLEWIMYHNPNAPHNFQVD